MNWITKLISKKTKETAVSRDIPDNLWIKCPQCTTLLFRKDISKNNEVCTNCDYHFFLPVKKRLDFLFDTDQYMNITMPQGIVDPLKFKDKEKYIERLKNYKERSGYDDAIVAGYGKIGTSKAVIAVMNFAFMGGSMGTAVGEGFVKATEQAIEKRCPFIIVTASGGARMQEGMFSLMQMAKTTAILERLKEAGLPYIVILANPTTGGVTASFAMMGDIHIAEQKATIGFAGARVIEQTIRKKLPDGFQRAEYLLEHGMVDVVVHRKYLKDTLQNLLDLLIHKVKAN